MNQIDYQTDILQRGLGEETMAKVENVPLPASSLLQHCFHPGFEDVRRGQHGQGIQDRKSVV